MPTFSFCAPAVPSCKLCSGAGAHHSGASTKCSQLALPAGSRHMHARQMLEGVLGSCSLLQRGVRLVLMDVLV